MSKQAAILAVEVVDIQGHCPIHQVGDFFQIEDGYKLAAGLSLCMHALQSICPYYVALSRNINPADLGLAGPDGAAYIQCLDPHRYTGGGTVIFRISKMDDYSQPSPSGEDDND